MTATYTNAPATRTIDQVRLLVRDTVVTSALLQDEEITWFISAHPSVYLAAAAAAEVIAANYSGEASKKKVGDLELSYEGRANEYHSLAKQLRLQAARKAKPFSGGTSESGKDSQQADSDWARPAFTRDMDGRSSTGGVW